MFSSAVPVQLGPTIWQALHDGTARVEMISVIALGLRLSPPDDLPPVLIVSDYFLLFLTLRGVR